MMRDTLKSEHGYKGGWKKYSSNYKHCKRRYQGGGKLVNVCDSQSLVPQPQPVYQNPAVGNRLMTRSWTCWKLRRTQPSNLAHFSYTFGDAIDMAVQERQTERQNPRSTSKDERSTKGTDDERRQKNEGKINSQWKPQNTGTHEHTKQEDPKKSEAEFVHEHPCVHTLTCCTNSFSAHSALTAYFAHFSCVSHTRMAQGAKKVLCTCVTSLHVAFACLMTLQSFAVSVRLSLSLSRLSRPHVPAELSRPESAGHAHLRTRTRSLAIWPSPPSTQVTIPTSSTISFLWTMTRC